MVTDKFENNNFKNIKPLIILGSARKNGDTKKLVEKIFSAIHVEEIDLLDQ